VPPEPTLVKDVPPSFARLDELPPEPPALVSPPPVAPEPTLVLETPPVSELGPEVVELESPALRSLDPHPPVAIAATTATRAKPVTRTGMPTTMAETAEMTSDCPGLL
jgi:hypothetical protein